MVLPSSTLPAITSMLGNVLQSSTGQINSLVGVLNLTGLLSNLTGNSSQLVDTLLIQQLTSTGGLLGGSGGNGGLLGGL